MVIRYEFILPQVVTVLRRRSAGSHPEGRPALRFGRRLALELATTLRDEPFEPMHMN